MRSPSGSWSPARGLLAALCVGALLGCGASSSPGRREDTPATASSGRTPSSGGATAPSSGGATAPSAGLDPARVAAPLIDVITGTAPAVLLRGALVKSDEPPTDAWDESAAIFGRAYCIGETCFRLVDLGERSVPASTVTAVGSAGVCDVEITRARAVRARLDAHDERPAIDQSFVLLEVGPCAAHPDARLEAIFGARPTTVLSLRDAPWQPASAELSAALDAREEVNRSLTPDRQRVPIMAAEIPECGITLARGLAVYWIREGAVNQPFDAARFVTAGDALYAFSYVEGLDPLLERLDRVTCTPE